jgi:hypothetical protein
MATKAKFKIDMSEAIHTSASMLQGRRDGQNGHAGLRRPAFGLERNGARRNQIGNIAKRQATMPYKPNG